MNDELAELVVKGIKTGTCSGHALYEIEEEAKPESDTYSIVLDAQHVPKCVIYTTEVQLLAFKEVTAHHAFLEGEGDLSLAYWQKEHLRFFKPAYQAKGLTFDDESLLLFEIFEVLDVNPL